MMPFRIFKRYPLLTPMVMFSFGLILFPAFTIWYVQASVNAQAQAVAAAVQQIKQSEDRRWCTLLRDSSSPPFPRKVPKPRPNALLVQKDLYRSYKVYVDLVGLERELGCS